MARQPLAFCLRLWHSAHDMVSLLHLPCALPPGVSLRRFESMISILQREVLRDKQTLTMFISFRCMCYRSVTMRNERGPTTAYTLQQ